MILVKKILKLRVLIFVFAFLAFAPSAFAETTVSGVIDTNTTWTLANSPYVVDNDLSIDSATLTIEPGVVVKVAPFASIALDQDGTISAIGTPTNKIYFTSLVDDEIGGDTNGDGNATIPDLITGEYFWSGIYSYGGNLGIVLSNAVVRYAERGFSLREASDVQIADSIFEKNFIGIEDQGKNSVNISNSEIMNNNAGISISQIDSEPNSTYAVSGLSIHGNNYSGVSYYILPPLAKKNSNPFIWFANLFKTEKALAQTIIDFTVDFRNTWWGDASGPQSVDNPTGLGDVIDDNGFLNPKVLFDPWLTTDPFIITPPLRNPVLIVPGVLGTNIFKGAEKLWLDLLRNFTDISDQFMDPLQFDNSLLPLDTSLDLGNVISRETVNIGLGNIVVSDYTFSLIKEFEDQGYTQGATANDNLFLFPYDWRYGVSVNNVNELKQKIQDIKTQTGSNEVDVVAHSTGGLLVKKYVMDNPVNNYIGKAVFVGVPNTGAPKAIKVLLQGDGFGIPWLADGEMKKISKNLPVVYDLSPSQEYYNQKGSYVKIINQGFFSSTTQNLDFNQANSFLTTDHQLNSQALANAQSLHTANFDNFDLRTAGVDLYSIAGCKAGTIGKIVERRVQTILGGISTGYDQPERVPGDGTVPLESATNLPINSENKYYALESDHGKMLSQDNIRQQIMNIISGSSLAVDSSKISQDISECKLNGKAISVFSPLDIEITDQDGNHAGLVAGGVENNIPNASFDIMGEHKFVYLPDDEGQTYEIEVNGTGNGTFTLKNEKITDNQIIQTEVFSDIPVTTNLTGNLNLGDSSTLSIDQNGDGNEETIFPDGSELFLNQLLALIKEKIQSLNAKDKLKQSLLKKIGNLEKKIEKKKEQNSKILTKFKNKITKQEMKGKINTTDANNIIELLDLLEAQAEDIALDPAILSQLKIKIQTLGIKQNQKNDMLKRVEKLENKQRLVKTLSNLIVNITKKGQKGKISATDAQELLNLLGQIESVI